MGEPAARRALLLGAAALVGAAGLGGEALLITVIGLLVGQARAAAFGLAVWIAAWALGAWLAGRYTSGAKKPLLVWGALAGVVGPAAVLLGLALAGSSLSGTPALAAGVCVIGLAALPQGGFLPLLARAGRSEDVSWLLGANLLGGVLGARLLAFDLPGAVGLVPASGVAGLLVFVASVVGCLASKEGGTPPAGEPTEAGKAPCRGDRLRMGLVVGLVTAWLGGIEWIGFRLGALWLGGMQPAVTAVLIATLLSLALGSSILPRILPRGGEGAAAALALAGLGTWVMATSGLPGRLADPAGSPVWTALLLVGPAVLPLGAVIPLLHRSLTGESGARLGGLLLHEVWGALCGVPLVHLVLVPRFGCGGAAALLACIALLALPLLPGRPGWRLVCGLVALGSGLLAGGALEPALATPALSRPEFEVRSFAEDEHFAVTVVHDGLRGETTLLTDDFRATAVGDDYLYMRVLGHLPLLLHPDPTRVGVLAFGTGTTAGAVAMHSGVERIDILELSAAVCEAAPNFLGVNGGVLEDSRAVVHLGDGRRTLSRFDHSLDVLTMEPLLPDSPFAVHLYTPGFYDRARRALAPGGLLCQWVPPQALAPETFDAVVGAFTSAFPWSGVFLFGTQVILVGGAELPTLDPRRFEAAGALDEALSMLGLGTPEGAAARFVTSGAGWPEPARALSDADPWVIFRPRRQGLVLLSDLPNNLAGMRGLEEDLPLAWQLVVGAQGRERLGVVRSLHRVREAWHRDEYEVRRSRLPERSRPEALVGSLDLGGLDEGLGLLAAAEDPEVALLLREVGFIRAYRLGFQQLTLGDPAGAFEAFGEAARLRPQAADVHLHAAFAAFQAGRQDVALGLAQEAYRLCPRLLETSPGQRLVALGLPAKLFP